MMIAVAVRTVIAERAMVILSDYSSVPRREKISDSNLPLLITDYQQSRIRQFDG
jgi:hypothetical protein